MLTLITDINQLTQSTTAVVPIEQKPNLLVSPMQCDSTLQLREDQSPNPSSVTYSSFWGASTQKPLHSDDIIFLKACDTNVPHKKMTILVNAVKRAKATFRDSIELVLRYSPTFKVHILSVEDFQKMVSSEANAVPNEVENVFAMSSDTGELNLPITSLTEKTNIDELAVCLAHEFSHLAQRLINNFLLNMRSFSASCENPLQNSNECMQKIRQDEKEIEAFRKKLQDEQKGKKSTDLDRLRKQAAKQYQPPFQYTLDEIITLERFRSFFGTEHPATNKEYNAPTGYQYGNKINLLKYTKKGNQVEIKILVPDPLWGAIAQYDRAKINLDQKYKQEDDGIKPIEWYPTMINTFPPIVRAKLCKNTEKYIAESIRSVAEKMRSRGITLLDNSKSNTNSKSKTPTFDHGFFPLPKTGQEFTNEFSTNTAQLAYIPAANLADAKTQLEFIKNVLTKSSYADFLDQCEILLTKMVERGFLTEKANFYLGFIYGNKYFNPLLSEKAGTGEMLQKAYNCFNRALGPSQKNWINTLKNKVVSVQVFANYARIAYAAGIESTAEKVCKLAMDPPKGATDLLNAAQVEGCKQLITDIHSHNANRHRL